ncbi:flagellar biosynthetic protein FlhB [Primorskyibacter sedentarius]|uniref:Flagellar biosynthetic protein FlhB n=1 Tax=Primorskyibacter sedentarius TaxID=745311 RepID=A0A4R3JM63_9RHOB|nr:flagellar type III secretion system protein FlhB [Primorskyibacter sedentarius]TCS66401.1 flagellar biosynthetic protein FlhB [Primorskyibacter sedentarius]
MSQGDDDSDKSHEPSQRKLEQARKKGDVAKSTDISTWASYSGLLIALYAMGASAASEFGALLTGLLDRPDELAKVIFQPGATQPVIGLSGGVLANIAPIFVMPAALVLLSLIAQRALVFAPTKLEPKLSRISLISNAKNKFGRNGLFEFAKSFAKLLIYSICVALVIRSRMDEILGSVRSDPATAILLLATLAMQFLLIVVIVSAAIGALDFFWQHAELMRKNRMSHKELRDEHKESEGDPYMRQARRAKAQEIVSKQMVSDVAQADVVLVNPTHYAVALKWSRAPGEAPVCVAKGVDEIAKRIREVAQENGVPMHSDPPATRALYASTEVGDMIAPEHYKPVAAAIRFAEEMRQRAKGFRR